MPDDLQVAAESGLPAVAPVVASPTVKRAPKFRNADNPQQTWAGRGRRPKWLKEKLAGGRSLDDFRIREQG